MREVVFLKKNEKKWLKVESLLAGHKKTNPDVLAELYIELTDDLAYAQTNYPESKSTIYLNDLTAHIYQEIYKNQKVEKNRFLNFWAYEVPYALYQSRRSLLYAFIAFVIPMLIGILSMEYEPSFAEQILGESYMEITESNINADDPMGIYKDSPPGYMWLYITVNNVRVSLYTMIIGIFAGIGSFWWVIRHGVMVGVFQHYFITRGVGWTAFLTIWQHGTIEISCLILAGTAGITLGTSFLFPGTYSRLEAFKEGAKRAVKIMVGIIPLIILAAFIEGFVTRHTEWPDALRLLIIVISAAFVVGYFVVYPYIGNKRGYFNYLKKD